MISDRERTVWIIVFIGIFIIGVTVANKLSPNYKYCIHTRGIGSTGVTNCTNNFKVDANCVTTEEGAVFCGDYWIESNY